MKIQTLYLATCSKCGQSHTVAGADSVARARCIFRDDLMWIVTDDGDNVCLGCRGGSESKLMEARKDADDKIRKKLTKTYRKDGQL